MRSYKGLNNYRNGVPTTAKSKFVQVDPGHWIFIYSLGELIRPITFTFGVN